MNALQTMKLQGLRTAPASLLARRPGATQVAAWVLVLCALLPWWFAAPSNDAGTRLHDAVEWPREWEGRAIRPLALSAVEQRFASGFPGAIARFTDDAGRVLIMRHVTRPTRMLHPAADCFRGSGYRVTREHLARRAGDDAGPWRCFEARGSRPGATPLRVCERIVGFDGGSHADTSSWFWDASLKASRGPWRAITVVEALP